MAVTTTAPTAAPAGEGATDAAGKGGRKKLLVILVAVLAIAGAAYWFLLRPTPEPAPEPGEVVTVEPIQVNLAGGHYLKIGVALQLTTAATHGADGAKALDSVIDYFSGRSMDEITRAEGRAKAKRHLMKEIEHDYHGDVMDLYFTDFVTQ